MPVAPASGSVVGAGQKRGRNNVTAATPSGDRSFCERQQPIRLKVGHGRLEVPRASHSEYGNQEWGAITAITALNLVFERRDGKGRVFSSKKTRDPLKNGRHWSMTPS